MEQQKRYSFGQSMLARYSEGRLSFLPGIQLFSVDLSTGAVSTGLSGSAYSRLTGSEVFRSGSEAGFRESVSELADLLREKQQEAPGIRVSLNLNIRRCSFMFSDGASSWYRLRAGRIALSSSGRIVYRDFGFSEDGQDLVAAVLDAYTCLAGQLSGKDTYPPAAGMDLSADTFILPPQAASFFVHEVVGHMLETDIWKARKFNIPEDQPFLPGFCSLVDDPAKAGYFAYGDYDDAGNRIQRTEAVVSGTFRECISLQRSAEYSHLPLPRMSCFALLDNPEGRNFIRMCGSYDRYIVPEEISSGGVNPFTGDFFISTARQYLVDEKHIRYQLPPSIYCGNVADLCARILEIGNDSSIFLGTCTKEGQNLYVCNSAPSMVISGLKTPGQRSGT